MIAAAVVLVPQQLQSQTITGRVTIEESGETVPGAFITVYSVAGRPASTGNFTDSDGRFAIKVAASGIYMIRAELLGFERAERDSIELGAGQSVDIELRLARRPIQLDTLEARAAALSISEEYSMVGVRRRNAQTPDAGPAQVVMQGDPEFRNASVIADVLRWMPPGRRCMVWFVNGFRTDWAMTGMSADMFEAVEVYQRPDVVPFIFKTEEIGCGVVAVWSREPGAPGGKKWTFGRLLLLGGIVGLLFFATQR